MKIFAVCQSGLGTSFMVEMNIKQALADLGADVDDFEVSHTDVGSVSSDMADYFFIEHSLKDYCLDHASRDDREYSTCSIHKI